MRFNWILGDKTDEKLQKLCIDLEYELRPKITRFLMMRLDNEFNGDFSAFHFDVDLVTKRITISDKTPVEYLHLFQNDFDREINQNCC